MNDVLPVIALLCAGLLTGNEFSVGVFIHPGFNRLPDLAHGYAARETARVFGRVMPFWMAANLLLTGSLVFVGTAVYTLAWWLIIAATVLFAVVIVFSIIFPVPINNRIAAWDLENLPADWRQLRQKWDAYHRVRVAMLIAAFLCLATGTIIR